MIQTTGAYIVVTQLPSKFLSYPDNVSIKFKPYSFGEIEQASQLKGAPEKEVIQAAQSGIIVEGMDFLDLEVADFAYLVLLRHLSTFDRTKFNLEFECPVCQHKNKKEVHTDEVEFNELNDRFKSLPVKFNLSNGVPIEVGGFTLRDRLKLVEAGEETNDLANLAIRIKNMPFEEAKLVIAGLDSGEDIDLLTVVASELDFNTQYVVSSCDHCHADNISIALEDILEIATPFRRNANDVLNRIFSGSQSGS